MSESWFYRDGEAAEHGPLTDDEFAQHINEGQVRAETPVRLGPDGDWTPAHLAAPAAFPAVKAEPAKAPAPPTAAEWTDVAPHPARRLAARVLDYLLLGGLLWALLLWAVRWRAPSLAEHLPIFDGWAGSSLRAMLTLLLLVPVQGLLLGLTGFTPGKWVFGVRVKRRGGLGVGLALQREARVWWRGLGAGVPVVCLFTLYNAMRRLEQEGAATWDKALDLRVTYREEGLLSEALMALVGAALAVVWFMTEIVGRSFWGS